MGISASIVKQLREKTGAPMMNCKKALVESNGDIAELTIDSFPDEVFKAEVVRIADEAEYTPRNVQTQEERQNTVYAIELSVNNKDGKLKPGMPADVLFQP